MTDIVPFTDLAAMARDVWPSVEADYLSHLLGGSYIGGPAVTSFEEQWAAYCQTDYAIGVGNGTDALELTLTALGIGPGDEVVVPANAFIAAPRRSSGWVPFPASPTSAMRHCS